MGELCNPLPGNDDASYDGVVPCRISLQFPFKEKRNNEETGCGKQTFSSLGQGNCL